MHFFTTGAVYEDPTLTNSHKRLHLKIVINSKKSEGTWSNTFETSIQEGSSSSGSEKVVHGLLIQKRCVQQWFVCYIVRMTTSPGNASLPELLPEHFVAFIIVTYLTFAIIYFLFYCTRKSYLHFQPEGNWEDYEMIAGIVWSIKNIRSRAFYISALETFSSVYIVQLDTRSYTNAGLRLGFTLSKMIFSVACLPYMWSSYLAVDSLWREANARDVSFWIF